MSNNSQQWNEHEHWLFMQQSTSQEQTAQSPSSDSYSPHSSTSDLSSSSHSSYHWASGTVPFDGSPVTAWAPHHPSLAPNLTTTMLPSCPTLQHGAPHRQHGPYHAECHPMGTICQYCMILHQFRESTWRRMHDTEPRDPNTGRSILLVLLAELPDHKGGRVYTCRICDEQFARPDRAVTHLRHKHLDHRPYACQGRCSLAECEQRFHSQENLSPHINPKTVDCRHCDHKCLRQNIKRHVQRYHTEKLEPQPKLA